MMPGADLHPAFMRWNYYDGSKIADITHADVNEHTLTPAALGLPANTVAILMKADRIVGTGNLNVRTVAAGAAMTFINGDEMFWPVDNTGVFRYSLSVANDDWDIGCYGYMTQQ